jgi:hypothetical protein
VETDERAAGRPNEGLALAATRSASCHRHSYEREAALPKQFIHRDVTLVAAGLAFA